MVLTSLHNLHYLSLWNSLHQERFQGYLKIILIWDVSDEGFQDTFGVRLNGLSLDLSELERPLKCPSELVIRILLKHHCISVKTAQFV